jgi:FkbM family methyltransferase
LPRAALTLRHVEPGVRLTVDLRRHVMFWSGGLARFEPYTVAVLRAAVAPGDVVFDVGANIGYFATILSRWVGPTGRVLAFEPEARNLAMLRYNLVANHCENVVIHPCALADRPGRSTFSVDASTGATGRLGEGATAGELAVGTGAVEHVEIAVDTIDALTRREGVTPNVIKMDIEGSEIDALVGASETLDAHRPIVIAELAGDRGAEVLAFLADRSYRLWDLESGLPIEPQPGETPFMVVAIPPEEVASDRGRRILDALDARRRRPIEAD